MITQIVWLTPGSWILVGVTLALVAIGALLFFSNRGQSQQRPETMFFRKPHSSQANEGAGEEAIADKEPG